MRVASSLVVEVVEVRPGDHLAADAEVGGDGPGRGGMVPGDHLHADPGPAAEGDGVGRLGAGRVDQADQRGDPQVVDQGDGVGRRGQLGLGAAAGRPGR